MLKGIFSVAVIFLLAGCASVPETPEGFKMKTVETEHLTFLTWEKDGIRTGEPLRFYIEGDGTPNPKTPVAFKMAQKDTHSNVIYVTRACQYIDSPVCTDKAIYTSARFHREIVNEMEEMMFWYIKKYKAPSVELVGYDGGATMALLLAAKLPHVMRVITIAGILDTTAYAAQRQEKLAADTLNPADQKNIIALIEQVHYVGGKDNLTPRRIAERFVARLQNPRSAVVKVLPSVSHEGWENVQLDFYR